MALEISDTAGRAAPDTRPSLSAMAHGIGAWLGGLTRWRRRGVLVVMGALAALALPPVHAVPLLFIAFPVLVWLIDRAPGPRAAFAAGWWFGFGHFVVGIYWITHSLLTEPEKFAWMIPFAVGGLGGVLAVFPALAAVAARLVGGGVARIVTLAIGWTAFEWLRGFVLTGFPWDLIGYSWAFADAMNQFAALAGIWGLSFFTVLAAAAPALLADGGAAEGQARPRRRYLAAGMCVLPLALIAIGGSIRLATATDDTVPDVKLRLVQPAIEQRQKNSGDLRQANLARHLALTIDSPGFETVTHVIWPETATPYLLEHDPELRVALGTAAPPGGVLLTGTLRGRIESGSLAALWNSLTALTPGGVIVGNADKFHLVPFGEYVPLRSLLPFMEKLTPGGTDFSAAPGPQTIRVPGLPPAGVLICYEAIFPGAVLDGADRPDWLINVTNDGWFGMSTGPYQHFTAARLRAVEEGVPLVRAANTGISGVVDAYGRVTAVLGLGKVGVLDVALPAALPHLTLYARFGDWTLLVLLAGAAIAVAALRLRERPLEQRQAREQIV
jgi:apolipoprotein N-acyltransferase